VPDAGRPDGVAAAPMPTVMIGISR
jgi:hypothetical protein